jgi:hypothetical protein
MDLRHDGGADNELCQVRAVQGVSEDWQPYEGPDLDLAVAEWARAYEGLKSDHGSVELPWLQDPAIANDITKLAIAGRAVVDAKGKIQMAPLAQPSDRRVFSSFWRNDIDGQRTYYVTVNFDRPY